MIMQTPRLDTFANVLKTKVLLMILIIPPGRKFLLIHALARFAKCYTDEIFIYCSYIIKSLLFCTVSRHPCWRRVSVLPGRLLSIGLTICWNLLNLDPLEGF